MNWFVLIKFKIIAIVILVFLFSPFAIFAQESEQACSPIGYSVFTINGIFTDETDAKENKNKLKNKLPPTFNNQPITVNYLHNETHIAGLGDLTMSFYQNKPVHF